MVFERCPPCLMLFFFVKKSQTSSAAIYAVVIIGLTIFNGYYMAPVDAVAILFLLQRARSLRSKTKAVLTAIAVVCFVIAVQNLATSLYFQPTERM
jgi:hypothetical protein